MAREPSALTFEALQEETGWDADRLRELADANILGRRQVVIAGPPGTGKTWVASLVARYVTDDRPGKVRLVQFHPSYTGLAGSYPPVPRARRTSNRRPISRHQDGP
jgi:MoxR-like ATPase